MKSTHHLMFTVFFALQHKSHENKKKNWTKRTYQSKFFNILNICMYKYLQNVTMTRFLVWRQREPAWTLLRRCRLCLVLRNFNSWGGHGCSIPARDYLIFCVQWDILWVQFLICCPIVSRQCRARVATPGVEKTNAQHGIRSLILNCHAARTGT